MGSSNLKLECGFQGLKTREDFRNYLLAQTGSRYDCGLSMRSVRLGDKHNQYRLYSECLYEWPVYCVSHIPNILLCHKVQVPASRGRTQKASNDRNRYLFYFLDGYLGSPLYSNSWGAVSLGQVLTFRKASIFTWRLFFSTDSDSPFSDGLASVGGGFEANLLSTRMQSAQAEKYPRSKSP